MRKFYVDETYLFLLMESGMLNRSLNVFIANCDSESGERVKIYDIARRFKKNP